MDSNKNEQCCFNTNTHGGHVAPGRTDIIETGCIAKTVSAAKYQNQFNNNNLIEQENLMPPVKDDDPPAVGVGQNGGAGVVPSDLHAREKVFPVNGSSPNVCAIFSSSSSSSSSSVSVARNAYEERVPSGQQNVECLTNTITTTTTTSSFTPAINGTGPSYIRPTNSGISESLPRSSIADPSLDPSVAVGGSSCERRDELTLEAVAKVKSDEGAGAGAPDDGDFSDNNSIGNLSYISENGLIEEIILLPNNAYSDDDNASTSDDCIYAYRGGEPGGAAGLLLELRGDQPPDDETDFLEMDFDPEPSSEMENFDSSQQEQVLEEDGLAVASSSLARANEAHHSPEASSSNSPRKNASLVRTLRESDPVQKIVAEPSRSPPAADHVRGKPSMEGVQASASPVLSSPGPIGTIPPQRSTEEKQYVEEIHDTGGKADLAVCTKTDEPSNSSQAHKTGAIPKAVPQHYASPERDRTPGGRCSSNAKNLKLDLNLCLDDMDGADGGAKRRYMDHLLYYEPPAYPDGPWADTLVADSEETVSNEDFEFYCSECGNLEFTSKLWMDHEPDSWMCKNCAFAQDEKLFRRRPDSFRQRANENERRETEPSGPSDAEAFDIRAEQIAMEALSKINTLKELPPSGGQLSWQAEQQYSRNRSIMASKASGKEQYDQRQDQEVPNPDYYHHGVGTCAENTVTIYTINCGELTIIEALTRIGIAPNLDVLRQYFTEQYHVDTSKMNIPQYLLHMSKRDCNYKKLIEAIKSCCDEETLETLDIQYYPFDPFTDMPEIVQISSCEIAKRWNANTNLRQIIHFKHKHFHTLNVLGKIVNIIRQPSRGRHTTHTIGIPQYYKSGSVTITRTTGLS